MRLAENYLHVVNHTRLRTVIEHIRLLNIRAKCARLPKARDFQARARDPRRENTCKSPETQNVNIDLTTLPPLLSIHLIVYADRSCFSPRIRV